jgi:hypothetical protein
LVNNNREFLIILSNLAHFLLICELWALVEKLLPIKGRHRHAARFFSFFCKFLIIQQQPPVYAQPEQPRNNCRYRCRDQEGCYACVKSCEEGWMRVVPDITPSWKNFPGFPPWGKAHAYGWRGLVVGTCVQKALASGLRQF